MSDWELYNEDAVSRLLEDDPDVLPEYSVDTARDITFNKQQINSCITSSIIRGSSVETIADELSDRISGLNQTSAVRTARTGITSAQNGGRLDSYYAARELGIDVKKEWVACLDSRTRDSHEALDGKIVDLDESFGYGLRYPGDSSASPAQVYNCRCTMVASLPGDKEEENEAERRSVNLVTKKKEIVKDISFTKWCGTILRPYFSQIDNQKTANGIIISTMSDHALLRTHDRNVSQEDIIDAIKNPVSIENIKYDNLGRPSQDFVGNKATVSVNPENGIITTLWRVGSKHNKKYKKGS